MEVILLFMCFRPLPGNPHFTCYPQVCQPNHDSDVLQALAIYVVENPRLIVVSRIAILTRVSQWISSAQSSLQHVFSSFERASL